MKNLVLLLFLAVVVTCKQEETFQHSIDRIFSAQFKADEPGGAIAILKKDSVVFSNVYGLADLNTKEKITTKTLFNTGSISKTFVSNTILSLALEGKLSLNDSLYKYFPDFKNTELAKKVRIHHLLTHTSGLADNRRQFLDSVVLLTAKDEENFAPIKLADSLLFEPGSRYEYSNPAFNGLALIIEKVTGRKWQEVVKEKIFDPAGMKTSVITDGPFPESGVSHGYLKTSSGFIEKDYGEEPTFPAAGNGGVWTSVEELIQYEQAIQRTAFLTKEVIDRSRTITEYLNWNSTEKPFIGYSWFIETLEDGSKMISHTGTQGGFYCDYVSIPSKGIIYVMLCNVAVQQEPKREQVLEVLKKFNWLN
jgi:CubicO group peptidase (beta-lactamase class C family)